MSISFRARPRRAMGQGTKSGDRRETETDNTLPGTPERPTHPRQGKE